MFTDAQLDEYKEQVQHLPVSTSGALKWVEEGTETEV